MNSSLQPGNTVKTDESDSALIAKIIEKPEQVKQELDLNKKRLKNGYQQIELRKKLIHHYGVDSLRSMLSSLFYIACFGALLMPNPRVQRAGVIGAISVLAVNAGAICISTKREMALKQRLSVLEDQEKELV